jgi:prostaglandin-endoperoxide synthase 2
VISWVFNAATFTSHGMQIIESTRNRSDILNRNVPGSDEYFVSLTRRDWRRQ